MDPQNQPTQLEPQSPITAQPPQENNVNKILITIISVLAVVTAIAGGYYFWKNKQIDQQTSIIPTQTLPPTTPTPFLQPSPTQQPLPTPDQFAGWKTYENKKYGFELKYPNNPDITLLDCSQSVNGGSKDRFILAEKGAICESQGEGWIIYSDPPVSESYMSKACSDTEDMKVTKSKITINNIPIIKCVYVFAGGPPSRMTVYFENNGLYTGLNLSPGLVINSTLFDQILSTFRFTGQNNTPQSSTISQPVRTIQYKNIPGWTKFSSEVGYSIQLPSYEKEYKESIKGDGSCYKGFNNDFGAGDFGVQILSYNGESRRQLFFKLYPETQTGNSIRYEDVVIQGKKSLIIEVGPPGDSGTVTGIVIPVGKTAMIVTTYVWNDKDSEDFNNLLRGLSISDSLDISKCGQ